MNSTTTLPEDRTAASARESRRREKARQIVEAATEVFLEHGFAASSMDKIVETAGVSKRTLYNHYGSKEEIFIGVMQTLLGSIFEKFSPGQSSSEDLAGQMRLVGIELLALANAPATLSLFRITAAEAQRFPKLAQQFFEQSFENVILGIASILHRESEKSGIHSDDTRQAGEYFLDLLTGTAYLRVIFGTTPPMTGKAIASATERALNYFFAAYPAHKPTRYLR